MFGDSNTSSKMCPVTKAYLPSLDSLTISKEIKLQPFSEFRLTVDDELKIFLKEVRI